MDGFIKKDTAAPRCTRTPARYSRTLAAYAKLCDAAHDAERAAAHQGDTGRAARADEDWRQGVQQLRAASWHATIYSFVVSTKSPISPTRMYFTMG